MLRFMAVTLYELEKKRIPLELIKSVFELHITTLLGMSPDLRACRICACYEHVRMFFDMDDPCIVCGNCIGEYSASGHDMTEISQSLLYSMRFIVFSDVDRIYKLEIKNDDLKILSAITEKYLLRQLDRNFRTLDYYRSIKL